MVPLIYLLLPLIFFSCSCQMGYIIRSAKEQVTMMSHRVPINEEIKKNNLNSEQKRKLELALEVREFAFADLKLKRTKNYETFIDLKRPFVSWVVHAATKNQLINYQWDYPIVGKMPYKGFFTEEEANAEAQYMNEQGYDTFVRGVTAYSTLGYFADSVLSSMLRYSEEDLVNTIIHELVHSTLYIKNSADFNERLAVFIGAKGTELFYEKKEGKDSTTIQKIRQDNEDEKKFGLFITSEIKDIEKWYSDNDKAEKTFIMENRQKKFDELYSRYVSNLIPTLQTKNKAYLQRDRLNNAYLGLFKTYMQDLSDFEKVFQQCHSDINLFIEKMKSLESSKNPEIDLKAMIQK